MKVYPQFFIFLILSLVSSLSSASMRLVDTGVYVPDEPIKKSEIFLNANSIYAGEFSLDEDSHLTSMRTQIGGEGSVLLAIYSQNSKTGLPGDMLFHMLVDVKNVKNTVFTGIDVMSVILNKGKYWFVIEAVNVINELTVSLPPLKNPLNRYVNYSTLSQQWTSSEQLNFPLIIEGHPTGSVVDLKCSSKNVKVSKKETRTNCK